MTPKRLTTVCEQATWPLFIGISEQARVVALRAYLSLARLLAAGGYAPCASGIQWLVGNTHFRIGVCLVTQKEVKAIF